MILPPSYLDSESLSFSCLQVEMNALGAVSQFKEPIASGTTLIYRAVLLDEEGAVIDGAKLNTFSLSLVNTKTGDIINSTDGVNILNADRGTIDGDGNIAITLTPDDTSLAETERSAFRSIKLHWTYGDDGEFAGRHQVNFRILALSGD